MDFLYNIYPRLASAFYGLDNELVINYINSLNEELLPNDNFNIMPFYHPNVLKVHTKYINKLICNNIVDDEIKLYQPFTCCSKKK